MQGFIVNYEAAAVTAIGTSYAAGKRIRLKADRSVDNKSKDIPSSCYVSHLELEVEDESAGGGPVPTTLNAKITYDDNGDDVFAGPTGDVTLDPNVSAANKFNLALRVDGWPTMPTDQTTANQLVLFLKVDQGTIKVSQGKVRLHWVSRSGKP
jgi:hypothetical protein